MPRNAVIMGAAGRDFHNFNVFFRDNPTYRVVAFTAAQLPFIENRKYPAKLAGRLYPKGIPIFGEETLPALIRRFGVRDVFFSYSDVPHEYVMHTASKALACGASFHLLGPRDTTMRPRKPVIAVVAVRSGAGKSMVCRRITDIVKGMGLKPVVVRHPMPYGELRRAAQRFTKAFDLDRFKSTLEEREEIEGHLAKGVTVYTGVDYQKVLEAAEREGDILLWDGGNNDFSFYRPSVNVVVADALREGHETRYYPGETNLMMADIVVINKVDEAGEDRVRRLVDTVRRVNPCASIVKMKIDLSLDKPKLAEGRRVLVVEDGPTITHGGLAEAAGAAAARRAGAKLVDPRAYAVGSIRDAYEAHPHIGAVLPALGYNKAQFRDLEATIASVDCDSVVLGTPADLTKVVRIDRPVARVRVKALEVSRPSLRSLIKGVMKSWRAI